jgi:hypothetical protein
MIGVMLSPDLEFVSVSDEDGTVDSFGKETGG